MLFLHLDLVEEAIVLFFAGFDVAHSSDGSHAYYSLFVIVAQLVPHQIFTIEA